MHRLSEPSGKVRCLSCAEADCVIATPTAQGPIYRCFRCGPVLRFRFPTDVPLPECYIRSYDELTERLRVELVDEEPEPDIEASELRVSPRGCVICKGEISFRFYLRQQQVARNAWCDKCGMVVLVTDEPREPKFRPAIRPRLRLAPPQQYIH